MKALAAAADLLSAARSHLMRYCMDNLSSDEPDESILVALGGCQSLEKIERQLRKAIACPPVDTPILPKAKKSPRKRSHRPPVTRDEAKAATDNGEGYVRSHVQGE